MSGTTRSLSDTYPISWPGGRLSFPSLRAAQHRTGMIVHLIDGTYELFRHFYGLRRFTKGEDRPFGAVAGVLHTVLQMIETGATHLGVATDHVIESFRNDLWPGYKTGDGVEPRAPGAVPPARGGTGGHGSGRVAHDGAGGRRRARLRGRDSRRQTRRVQKVCIWTPDKDLAQCVRGDRVVQVDRRGSRRSATPQECGEKFGVEPVLIPDFLALVGDAADGYPGIPGIGATTAARLLNRSRRHRALPAGRTGRQSRPGAAVQEPGNAPDRRARLRRRGRAAVAGAHRRIPRVGGAPGRRPPPGALRQGPGRYRGVTVGTLSVLTPCLPHASSMP